MGPLLLAPFLLTAPLLCSAKFTDHGTFSNPASNVRPRFRYWLPDASVDAEVVAEDVAAVAQVGGGGMEFVPFFDYGGALNSNPPVNWSTYGFGTPPFVELFKTALQAHSKHGLLMDFALGPNQGQGVPASPDNEGLEWELVPFSIEIPKTGQFEGVIPGWGTGDLVSLVIARVKSNRTFSYELPFYTGDPLTISYDEFELDHQSVIERTRQVGSSGHVRLSLPKASSGSHYRMFAFYERLAGYKNLRFPSNRDDTIFDNGSYAVDHFDAKGAQVISQFWSEYILTPELTQLLGQVGKYAWEDSLELEFNITWSRSLPRRFRQLHGYDIQPYLPLLTFQQNTLATQQYTPGAFRCYLDTADQGIGYVNDFRAALVAGYKEYLGTLRNWAQGLGAQLSVQPAYGSIMDALAVVPSVDAPECESLSFVDNIDLYRAFSGPAHLAGKRIVSNEMGAVQGAAYNYHFPALVRSVNRAFLGGVNQMVLHGQAYSGPYPNTTWPGHTSFRYLFSELLSPKLPSWGNGMKGIIDYISRVQYLLQTSVPKVDVVMYHKQSATSLKPIYQGTDLLREGWSWNYLSSDNLFLEQAKVQRSVLAQDGPAWKALIIDSTQNLTLDAVDALDRFSQDGLPVIFSGGPPGYYPSEDGSDLERFKRKLSRLLKSPKIHVVANGGVANKLKTLGLRPLVQVNTNGACYTSWSEADGQSYAVVFSDSAKSTGTITVQSTKTPYLLDPWTGTITPVLVYQRTRTATTIPVALGVNQAMYFAFGNAHGMNIAVPRYHVQQVPSHVLGSTYLPPRGIALHVARSYQASHAVLSTGKKVLLKAASVPPAFPLSHWNLTAEHWEAPEDLYDSQTTVKYNTTHQLDRPISWSEVPQLSNASGVGYYTTKFQWPPSDTAVGCRAHGEALGAYLKFSQVVDTLAVSVNGQAVPQLDITNAAADITEYLRPGENLVSVTVPTTLWNYLKEILDELVTAGQPVQFLGGTPTRSEAGLVGTVSIVPYTHIFV
ncbi:hypothetical protein BJY01DRAFT_263257 [Aspergillus pseudoustus]|uniref:Secreted protein n=1 Tax=Aspergillus pseudoustus TaxID=1810923 RepID=A0ABR4K2Z4_9EURO